MILENVQVDYPQGKNVACQLRIDDDKYIAGLFELAEAVHSYGTKIFMQIHHAGRQTTPGVIEGLQPVAPSPIPCGFLGVQPRELTLDEIEDIIQKFVNAAVRAKIAGFDGIELHGAHGYLIGQFMSPRTNKRVDQYGAVITVGVIRNPEFAEKIIASGKADFVSIGRGLIADPEWPRKAKEGRFDEIRKCISCNIGCIGGHVFYNLRLRCSINPCVGHEALYGDIKQSSVKKKVVVVGGGPAGMQAAIVAAKRGHRVILIEKEQSLGGQLQLAAVPPGKSKINWFNEWLKGELSRAGVEVKTGVEADAEYIAALAPDCVIIATGSEPVKPKIRGANLENAHIFQAWDVLRGRMVCQEGEKVVVVGGGLVGCETAHYLAEKGAKVVILEMLPEIAADMEPISRFDMMQIFNKIGVKMKTNVTVTEITTDGVVFVDKKGQQGYEPAQKVVLAIGQSPVGKELKDALEQKGIEVRLVGDAEKVGKIIDAVASGFQAGWQL